LELAPLEKDHVLVAGMTITKTLRDTSVLLHGGMTQWVVDLISTTMDLVRLPITVATMNTLQESGVVLAVQMCTKTTPSIFRHAHLAADHVPPDLHVAGLFQTMLAKT
jgi:hypothetical protein